MTLRLRSLKRRFAETSTLFSSARQSERLAYTSQHRSGDRRSASPVVSKISKNGILRSHS